MKPPEGSLYRPILWSLALLFGAAGLLLMIQTISAEIGPFRFAELGARDPRSRVGLWVAADAERSAGAHGEPWGAMFGGDERVLEISSLAALDPAALGAVVLPEPRALGSSDAAALSAYLAAGGGAVLTGSVGVRGADGAWRGYDVMRGLLGGAEPVPLDATGAEALLASRRGVLSSLLVPRERIAIRAEPGLPAVAGGDAELAWAAASADGESMGLGASLRRSVGRGRLVWLAVGPERAARDADARALGRVLRAAVAWVARLPLVEVLPWPGGAPFAATIEPRGEDVGPLDATALRFAVASELDAAEASAGLARLRAPSRAAAQDVVADATSELAQRGAWLATRSELASWTRQRSSIEATVRRAGPQRLVVAVTNRAPDAVRGVVLRLYLNENARSASVEATQLLQATPVLRFRAGAESLDLALPDLARRASAAFTLDYEPAAAGSTRGDPS
ncbi:MAG TPA: hypothetical protein VMH82_19255 [Myxococcota bacterium]|nr:hypothetical protein [Myxococcota bacterium]